MHRRLDRPDQRDGVDADQRGHEQVADQDDLHDDPEHAKGREGRKSEVDRRLERANLELNILFKCV